ncbi:MAG: hypothetical protein QNJ91_05450 [Gammaproteobacteria bacterium]|nr:hypothetical protein [Gammaproteobacteria bacterium]
MARYRFIQLLLALAVLGGPARGVAAADPLVVHFLAAADAGQCIESVAFRLIRQHGGRGATQVVRSALIALGQREAHQRALGCSGDIAAQAIAAGADPAAVLQATAAGL